MAPTHPSEAETRQLPALKSPSAAERDLMAFLESAGQGCISGNVADWPQLKPACRWAAEEIKRLRGLK
ncbi:MAG: hypothetical protein WC869_00570 [Phycisphaerae bacterium]|jgi:hypothetical protein